MRALRGFTLIELMITVAVVAILAIIAYPSYQDQVRKTRRSIAKTALLTCAQNLERLFTMNNSYAAATIGTNATDTCRSNPPDGFYTISFSAGPAATTYTVQAQPTGDQANDKCKTFTLDQAGTKAVAGGATLTAAKCW